MDKFQDIRSDMVLALESVGVRVEVHHHEVATGGQTEIDMRYDTLTKMADKVCWYKYCAKNTRRMGQDGHLHAQAAFPGQRLRHAYAPVDLEERQEPLLRAGRLRRHLQDLSLLHRRYPEARAGPARPDRSRRPTPTSGWCPATRRPINLVYSQRNRSAAIRIPVYSKSEGAKRIEFRTPDPTCNPYLSFAACVMAGLDGVANKIDPGKPVDKDLYELPPAEQKKIKQLPGALDIVLENLEKSHDWLLKGDVFTPDVIETWIEYKRKNEVDAVRLRPHPWEFALYFDI